MNRFLLCILAIFLATLSASLPAHAATVPVAWGSIALGNGTTTHSFVPVAVDTSGALKGKTITAIAAGCNHSLALTSEGRVYAWGYNDNGQLGDGTTRSSTAVPVAVDTSGVLKGKTVTAIAAGWFHSLALTSEGHIYAWGTGNSGELGDGTTGSSTAVPVAVDTSGVLKGKTIKGIAAGERHSLAMTSDGHVYAWGSNTTGELGNSIQRVSSIPIAVNNSGVLKGKTVTAIAAGMNHSLVVTSEGRVYAWGWNASGQLGNGTTAVAIGNVPVAVDTSGTLKGKTITAVAAGKDYSLALASDGRAYAWGYNNNGQLGNGNTIDSKIPVAIDTSGVLKDKTIVAIATRLEHSLALTSDGRVYAWGSGYRGRLGGGNSDDGETPNYGEGSGNPVIVRTAWTGFSSVPVAVDTSGFLKGKTVTAIAAGGYQSLALASDGAVSPPAGPASIRITSPVDGSTEYGTAVPNIYGQAGAEITSSIEVTLQRQTTGLFWTGSKWGNETLLKMNRTGTTWNGANWSWPSGPGAPDDVYIFTAIGSTSEGKRVTTQSRFTLKRRKIILIKGTNNASDFGRLMDRLHSELGYEGRDTDILECSYSDARNPRPGFTPVGEAVKEFAAKVLARKKAKWGGENAYVEVDIIAHSAGGLVAREYANSYSTVAIKNIITLGTPLGGILACDEIGITMGLFAENVLDDMRISRAWKNPHYRDVSGITYWKLGGNTKEPFSFESVGAFGGSVLYNAANIVEPKKNDGLVNIRSARGDFPFFSLWTQSDSHYAILPLNHGNLTQGDNGADTIGNYIFEALKNRPWPTSSNDAIVPRADDTEDSPQVVESKPLTLVSNTPQSFVLPVDGTAEATFSVINRAPATLSLRKPDGATITSNTQDPTITYTTVTDDMGLRMTTYTIANPAVGNWTVDVSPGPVPAGQDGATLLATVNNGLSLIGSAEQDEYPSGAKPVFLATLAENGAPLSGAQVTVSGFIGASSFTAPMFDNGTNGDVTANDGIYTVQLPYASSGGLNDVSFKATGANAASQSFQRVDFASYTVSPNSAVLKRTYSDKGLDTDADGTFEFLQIDAGVTVSQTGNFMISADLQDANGEVIDSTQERVENLEKGSRTIALRFDGRRILKHGQPGPCKLANVKLYADFAARPILLDTDDTGHTTKAYTLANFDHAPVASISQPATAVVMRSDAVELAVDVSDEDDNATFGIYYDTDNRGFDGTLIQSGLGAMGARPVTWDTTAVPDGLYYIYVVATDGIRPEVKVYAPGSIRIDRTKPLVSVEFPTNGFAMSRVVVINGKASDTSGSGIDRVEMALKRNSDGKYWTGSAWGARTALSTIFADGEWRRDSGQPADANLPEGKYTIEATTYDKAGNSSSVSSGFTIDRIAPASLTIQTPTNGATVTSLPLIRGTAGDNAGGSGIAKVEVILKRNSDNKYWTGTAWGARTLLTTTLNGANWTRNSGLPTGVNLPSGSYTVGATATDNARHSLSINNTFTLKATTTPPSVSVTTPRKNVAVRDLPQIVGRAYDRSGTAIARVEFALKRDKDGKYWTGTTWGARTILSTSFSIDTWMRTTGLPTGANLPDGSYTIGATAFDRYNNGSGITRPFVVDATVPATLTITAPANNATVSSLTRLSGAVADNKGGSGIASVKVVLRRNSDGKYWTGSAWGARTPLNAGVSNETWQVTSGLPSGANLTMGSYTIGATAYDRANNTKSVNSNFTVSSAVRDVEVPNSPLGLSTAVVHGDSIRLTFTGPLDVNSATDPAHYIVAVDGRTVAIESVALEVTATVVFRLPPGSVKPGGTVKVSYKLRDAKGRPLIGEQTLTT